MKDDGIFTEKSGTPIAHTNTKEILGRLSGSVPCSQTAVSMSNFSQTGNNGRGMTLLRKSWFQGSSDMDSGGDFTMCHISPAYLDEMHAC